MELGLLNVIKRKKLSYFGHEMGKEGDCLEKEIMQLRHYTGCKKTRKTKDAMDGQNGRMDLQMPFEDGRRPIELDEKQKKSGVDFFMKRPTLGSRMDEDKTRPEYNYDNLYGAVTRPYRYKGASQATKQAKPERTRRTGKF